MHASYKKIIVLGAEMKIAVVLLALLNWCHGMYMYIFTFNKHFDKENDCVYEPLKAILITGVDIS